MSKFLTKTRYYYCPDYKRYVKCEGGIFYVVNNDGNEEIDRFYDKILIGDIFTDDISKEEYYAQLHQGSFGSNQGT